MYETGHDCTRSSDWRSPAGSRLGPRSQRARGLGGGRGRNQTATRRRRRHGQLTPGSRGLGLPRASAERTKGRPLSRPSLRVPEVLGKKPARLPARAAVTRWSPRCLAGKAGTACSSTLREPVAPASAVLLVQGAPACDGSGHGWEAPQRRGRAVRHAPQRRPHRPCGVAAAGGAGERQSVQRASHSRRASAGLLPRATQRCQRIALPPPPLSDSGRWCAAAPCSHERVRPGNSRAADKWKLRLDPSLASQLHAPYGVRNGHQDPYPPHRTLPHPALFL